MCYTGWCPYEEIVYTNSGNHIACDTKCNKPLDEECPLEIKNEEEEDED